jgi:outer membrane protein OmpA-like peptidoglycan-associated protein
MKLQYFLIPAFAVTTLQLSAQKNSTSLENPIGLQTENEPTVNNVPVNSVLYENKMTFIDCWIHPMDELINSQYPEYTPVLNEKGDLMIFTSRRPENTGNRKTIDPTYKAEDIYFSTKDAEGNWSKAAKLSGKLNTFKNDAVTWISANGKTMILCQNEDLFQSSLIDGAWTKPEPMNILNSDYRETHASFSPDGNTLYFTTDNPELATVGGLDICKVEKDASSGEWKKPVIVDHINSVFNEEDPTLMQDGKTLYFSSQGFGSLGGYDIYKTNLNADKTFSEPVNLGFPLNTDANEPFISVTADGKKAYLSSDRGKIGDQNIYEITFHAMINIPLLVEVYDANTKKLINSNATLVDLKKDKKEIYLDNLTSGVFGAEGLSMNSYFLLTVDAKNYETQAVDLTTHSLTAFNPDTFKMVQKVYLQPIKKHDHEMVSMDKMVYFDVNKSTLNAHALHIMNKVKEFMLSNPTATIVVHAHTDSKGSDELNHALSKNRAQSVMDWLIQNGIDANRIMMKPYGETKPMMDNETDENRAKNRRAEIEIIME